MKISIVIPAYNEESNLRDNCLDINMVCPECEWICVDDGSTDSTALLASFAGCRVISIPHSGKAAAIIAGIIAASGEYVLVCDMDMSTPIHQVYLLLNKALDTNADVVIGSRGHARPGSPARRMILTYGQYLLRRVLFDLPYADTQCGFKLYKRESALKIINKLAVYKEPGDTNGSNVSSGFDVECLLVARSLGMSIAEVPVLWQHKPSGRVRVVRDAIRGALGLCAIWIAQMGGAYGSQKIPVTELIMVLIVTLACLSLGSLAPAIIAIPAVAYKYLFGRKHETSKIQQ